MNEKIVVVMGPTASGKTALGIKLAQKLNGEIISGDAFQVYKTLDIGTAKVTEVEREGVPHHLIDCKEPDEGYTVGEFCQLARVKIAELTARGKIPIIVGGTGLYIQALLEGYNFPDQGPLREHYERYNNIYEREGLAGLVERMKVVAPEYFDKYPTPDKQRLIRALSLLSEGKSYEAGKKSDKPLYRGPVFALIPPRDILYERIHRRVDNMITQGLEEEARALWMYPPGVFLQSRKGIGYHEWEPYFYGDASLKDVIAKIKMDTRRFAKRQITWIRRMSYVQCINPMEYESTERLAEQLIPTINKEWKCSHGNES